MTEKQPMDTRSLNHLDKNLRQLVDQQYEFCLFKCAQKTTAGMANCKSACVNNVLVPYRFANHAAKDEEDNLYRKCLADKFPKIKAEDYVDCTQQLYRDRISILSNHMVKVYEELFTHIR
jgi:hypothetical protein